MLVEIGVRFGFEYWGNGFNKEAGEAVLQVVFSGLNFAEIIAYSPARNPRLKAGSIGMITLQGTFDHPGCNLKEPHLVHRLSRKQWEKRKSQKSLLIPCSAKRQRARTGTSPCTFLQDSI
jgi:RimJ/RimL family protein N-acetyltransferase